MTPPGTFDEGNGKRGPGPSARKPAAERMLDLPLSGPGSPMEQEPRLEHAPRPRSRRGPERGKGRKVSRRLLWVLLALLLAALAAVGAVLWPAPPLVSPSEARLDFGALRVGTGAVIRPLGLVNGGERLMEISQVLLTGDSGREFTLSADGCSGARLEPTMSCAVEVSLQVAETGLRSAALEVRGNAANSPLAIPLEGLGIAPLLAVDRTEVGFGTEQVGRSGAPQVLQVTNRGSAALEVRHISLTGPAADDFSLRSDGCSPVTLAPGESCSVRVVFSPRAAGERAGALRFDSDSLAEAPGVRLAGSGELVGPALVWERGRVDFERQPVGVASEEQVIRLANRGLEAIQLGDLVISEPGLGFAASGRDCSSTRLAPAAECEVGVVFGPVVEGPVRASLTVGLRGDERAAAVELSGIGVAARLGWSPENVDFGEVRTGRSSQARGIRLENRGTWPLEVGRLEIIGGGRQSFELGSNGCSGDRLEPGRGCSAEVVFKPRDAGGVGAELALSWSSDQGSRVEKLPLEGRGTAPRLQVSLEELEFGGVRLTTSSDRALVLRNVGTAPLAIREIELTDGGQAFRVATDTCTPAATLPPGGSCTVTVRFTPALPEGEERARLRVSHDGSSRPAEVPIRGSGRPPPVPELRASPGELRFGSLQPGERSAIVTVTLRNPGSGRLVFKETRIVGAEAMDFRIVPGSCSGAPYLAPGSECTTGLRFTPSEIGERRAVLRIRHNAPGGELTVPLHGSGVGGGP